jgi:hypothetical protein
VQHGVLRSTLLRVCAEDLVLQRAAASTAGEEETDDECLTLRSTVDEVLLEGEPVPVELVFGVREADDATIAAAATVGAPIKKERREWLTSLFPPAGNDLRRPPGGYVERSVARRTCSARRTDVRYAVALAPSSW